MDASFAEAGVGGQGEHGSSIFPHLPLSVKNGKRCGPCDSSKLEDSIHVRNDIAASQLRHMGVQRASSKRVSSRRLNVSSTSRAAGGVDILRIVDRKADRRYDGDFCFHFRGSEEFPLALTLAPVPALALPMCAAGEARTTTTPLFLAVTCRLCTLIPAPRAPLLLLFLPLPITERMVPCLALPFDADAE